MAARRNNLIVKRSICTGCRLCELVCSIVKEGESNPAKARIWIEARILKGERIPHVCLNCGKPPCIKACPTDALAIDGTTGWVMLDHGKCDSCGQCIPACPLGALRMSVEGKILKCDLCGGDPECVKMCDIGAIQFTAG